MVCMYDDDDNPDLVMIIMMRECVVVGSFGL